ncbi:MAG: hypothetical protein ACE5MI_12345 [Acidimicrobiia bacterium]
MDFVISVLLVILGAALIVGGVVAYRGSTAVAARALSAASVAAGLAMWFVIASVTITSSSGTAPEPVVVTSVKSSEELTVSEEAFRYLLTLSDVEPLLAAEVQLATSYRNFREMAESVDPAQVARIESWFGWTLESPSSADGLTFTLIDFDSSASASAHFEKMRSSSKAPPDPEESFGGTAYRVEMNSQGIGSMLVLVKGDKLLSFHTAISEGHPPMVTPEGLDELAELALSRL